MSKKMALWAFIPPYYITFANERKQHLHRQSFICGDSGSNQTTLSQESRSRDRRREGLSQRSLGSIPKKPGAYPKETWGLSQRSLGSIPKKPGAYPKEAWGLSQRSLEVYPDLPDITSPRSCPLPPMYLSPVATEAVDRLQQ